MIIEGFIVFMALALLFVIIGHYSENIMMGLAGCMIISLLAFTFLTGAVEFKSGETLRGNYSHDTDNVINESTEITTYNYSDFNTIDNVVYGLLLLFSGIAGMIGLWVGWRANWREGE